MESAAGTAGDIPATVELTMAHFEALIGADFTLHLPQGSVLRLVLERVQAAGKPYRDGARTPFSLLFRCPELPPAQYVQQGSYRFDQPKLGSLECFITPLKPDAQGFSYEAVFS